MKEAFPEMRSETYNPQYIATVRWSMVILFAAIAVVLLRFFIDALSEPSTDTASDMIFCCFLSQVHYPGGLCMK